MKLLAQEVQIGGETIKGPLSVDFTLSKVISSIINFLYAISGIILFFVIVWGGYMFLTSRGDAEKVGQAKAVISSGLIGFILLVVSGLLVQFLALIFGLDTSFLFGQ